MIAIMGESLTGKSNDKASPGEILSTPTLVLSLCNYAGFRSSVSGHDTVEPPSPRVTDLSADIKISMGWRARDREREMDGEEIWGERGERIRERERIIEREERVKMGGKERRENEGGRERERKRWESSKGKREGECRRKNRGGREWER